MSKDTVMNDYWIMGQLAGIRMLERELSGAFSKAAAPAELQRRVAQLNAWVNLVDQALVDRARSK